MRPLAQIVRGHFEGDFVTGDDTDVVLLQLAASVGDQVVLVVERDAITSVGENFSNLTVHFDKFFFSHVHAP